jgi:hypothetical protein
MGATADRVFSPLMNVPELMDATAHGRASLVVAASDERSG